MLRASAPVVMCLLLACSASVDSLPVAGDFELDSALPEPIEVQPPVTQAELLTESVGALWSTPLDTCTLLAVLQPHRMVCSRDGSVWLIDESEPSEVWLADAHTVAAAHVDGMDWLSLDGQLMVLVDDEPTALDLGIPVPIETLTLAGGAVWLHGAGRLFEVTEETVHEVKIDGVSTIHSFAATADMLYLATPTLLALDRSETGLVSRWDWPAPVDSLTVDDAGLLWFLDGHSLQVSSADGALQSVRLPGDVHGLIGGGALWLLGDGVVWRQAGQGFTEHALSTDGVVGADTLGRLLQLADGAVLRHSVGRPVAVVGLPESLEVQQLVQLLPSDPSSLVGLSAWVDQQAVTVETAPYRLSIDPEMLDGGSHELRFLTESELGDHLATWPLWVGELPDTTWEDIQQISEARCLACHGGDTVTLLQTAEDWRTHIDTIIELVSSGEMPLGGTPLSEDDIVRIRAWKHGGFE